MSIATVRAIFNRWLSLLLAALVAALLAGLPGCTGGPRPSLSQGETVVHPGQPRQMNPAYLIGPGDILEVSVLSAPTALGRALRAPGRRYPAPGVPPERIFKS